MSFEILTLEQSARWIKAWQALPIEAQDVYLLPQYLALYEKEHIQAQCALLADRDNVVLYPYLKTALHQLPWVKNIDPCYDIEGAYGYNAIVSNSDDVMLAQAFGAYFLKHCRDQGIIAEFMRVNPVLPAHYLLGHLTLKPVSRNIIVNLSVTMEDLAQDSYEHCVRKNIKKARQEGLQVRCFWGKSLPKERLRQFMDIYYHTMDRRGTGEEYYFTEEYFSRIARELPDNSFFAFADTAEGKAISCELVLVSRKAAYSFLGGTLQEYNALRPNNLLKHELMGALKSAGITAYCIGGGSKPDDGIYKYKKTFAKNGDVAFNIGTRVHDQVRYDELCGRWSEQFPQRNKTHGHFFLKYKF